MLRNGGRTSASGTYRGADNKSASYTLAMSYDNMHRIKSKSQHLTQQGVQFDGTLNAGYDLAYTYQDSLGHKFQLSKIEDLNYRTEGTPKEKIDNGHRYLYDANGNLTKITTPKGSEIHRSYDADDRLTEERVLDRKNGIDRRVQYAYDAAGNVLKQAILGTDGECLESSTRYDLKDRATHRTNPAGGVTRYLYDRNDRLRKEISPYGYEPESDDGAVVSYTYDSRGNRLRTTNALGEVVQELSYNLRNQPVIQKDTFGNRTELSYELDGKIKDVRRLGNGNRNHQRTLQQYEYNARGQITGVVDGNRNPISYDVDSWGRITGIGFADGVKEGYEYTPAGQVSRTIDGNGNAVQYRYNSLGKISERIDQLDSQRPSGMTRRATCPCTSTGTEDSCSAPATYSDSLCMRRRPMQRGNIPISVPGTMTVWAG